MNAVSVGSIFAKTEPYQSSILSFPSGSLHYIHMHAGGCVGGGVKCGDEPHPGRPRGRPSLVLATVRAVALLAAASSSAVPEASETLRCGRGCA